MSDPINRREFLEQTAATAVAAQLADAAALVGASAPAGPASYIDPLVRPIASALPEAQNALPLIQQAARLFARGHGGSFLIADDSSKDLIADETERRKAAWRHREQRAMELFAQAVGRGNLEFPPIPCTNDRLDESPRIRSLDIFVGESALRLAYRGELAGAARISCTLLSAFHLLEQGGGVFSEYLTAFECQCHALSAIHVIAGHADVDARILRDLLDRLARRDALVGLERAIRANLNYYTLPLLATADCNELAKTITLFVGWKPGDENLFPPQEYALRCDKLVRLFTGHPKPYDFIDTVKRASAVYADFARDLHLPWPVRPKTLDSNVTTELAAWPNGLDLSPTVDPADPRKVTVEQIADSREQLLSVENPIGKKVVECLRVDLELVHELALANQARYDETRLALAIRVFELETGALPADLDALAAARILEPVPLDPFSAEPFRYAPAERTIGSIRTEGRASRAVSRVRNNIEGWVWRLDANQVYTARYHSWPLKF